MYRYYSRTNTSVHDNLKRINNCGKAKSIDTFDFSKLYTNIPHDLLLSQIEFAVHEAFTLKEDCHTIRITKTKAFWSTLKSDSAKANSKTIYLTEKDILEYTKYLIENLYIKFFDIIFRQVIGVPMGSDCGPDLANLFLFSYEYKYILKLIDTSDSDYTKFMYIFRYIDDLISLNDKQHFYKVFKDIYPDVLTLNNTNISAGSCNYLDMNITITNSKFNYTLYDKRNDYDFNVISLPNLKSNVPVSPTYSVLYSQILRYFNATNNIDDFCNNVRALRLKMLNQNFRKHGIHMQISKFLNSRMYDIAAKFWSVPRFSDIL